MNNDHITCLVKPSENSEQLFHITLPLGLDEKIWIYLFRSDFFQTVIDSMMMKD